MTACFDFGCRSHQISSLHLGFAAARPRTFHRYFDSAMHRSLGRVHHPLGIVEAVRHQIDHRFEVVLRLLKPRKTKVSISYKTFPSGQNEHPHLWTSSPSNRVCSTSKPGIACSRGIHPPVDKTFVILTPNNPPGCGCDVAVLLAPNNPPVWGWDVAPNSPPVCGCAGCDAAVPVVGPNSPPVCGAVVVVDAPKSGLLA